MVSYRSLIALILMPCLLYFLTGCAIIQSSDSEKIKGFYLVPQEKVEVDSSLGVGSIADSYLDQVKSIYSELFKWDHEPQGYAYYSYVLLGRQHVTDESLAKYEVLERALRNKVTSAEKWSALEENANTRKLIASRSNLFLFPRTRCTLKTCEAFVSEPDYDLSQALLDVLVVDLSTHQLSGSGPYIVTLNQPISFYTGVDDTQIKLLFFDLSDLSLKAVPAVVKAYLKFDSSFIENVEGVERLEPMRIKVLNALLVSDKYIGYALSSIGAVKSAFAGE